MMVNCSKLIRRGVWACLLCCLSLEGWGQTRFRVMEYNVENLFDTSHDSLKNDQEFLPESVRKWDAHRYWTKLNRISQVIAAAGGLQLPDLVALCEVENDTTMRDLTKRSLLRTAGYEYIMTECADQRGIDVALLYQPATFRPLNVRRIDVHPERIGRRPTRDILHVTGLLQNSDTLDVFVCHMPSRAGGKAESDAYRAYTSRCLRGAVDSLMAIRRDARLLITGDFNDYPEDPALTQELRAGEAPRKPKRHELYNLMWGVKPGTYRYKGEWNVLDQMIVSGILLTDKKHVHTFKDKMHVFDASFLLEEDEKYGGPTPMRTYLGMKYHDGYSDHLPICLDLLLPEP